MTIHIESLTFDAIIGLLDFERERPQRVTIDLTAEYPYAGENFVDYAALASLTTDTVKRSRFKLLEEALETLEREIVGTYPQLTSLYIKISKPDILPQCRVGISQQWDY